MGDALVWWIALQLMGLAALPLGAVLLRALPDRGYSVSKPLGLLVVGWLAYILAMVRILRFDRLSLIICLLIVAGFSAWLMLRNDRALLRDLRAHFSTRSSIVYVVVCEVLFLAAFIIWAWVRAYNPVIDQQEKFMDFGFLNAILKSDTFPPNDMWLAGFSINYYYFGYVLIAGITALSGVPTQVAFNLANVTLYAMTALGAFGVVHNLITARLLAAGRAHKRERPLLVEETTVPSRPRERDMGAGTRRRQTVAAGGDMPPRRGATAPVPASALPARRARPRPEPVEEPPAEPLPEQIEFANDVDTQAEVLRERSEGRRARGRRARAAAPEALPEPAEAQPEEPFAAIDGEAPAAAGEGVGGVEGVEGVEAEPEGVVEEPVRLAPGRRRERGSRASLPSEEPAPSSQRERARPTPPPPVPPAPPAEPPYLPVGTGHAEPRSVPAYLSPYIFAVLAALMVVAMGNLTVGFTRKDGNSGFAGQPFVEGNGFVFCFMCNRPDGYNWFAPSRIISDFTSTTNADGSVTKTMVGYETINEFPAFSFLLADMHPHVLALPLVMLAISVGMAFARRRIIRAEEWRDGLPPGVEGWVSLGLAGLIAGSLYTTNTWDFPTYLLVIILCLIFPYLAAGRRLNLGARWLRPVSVQVVLLAAIAVFTFIPFHLTFKSLVGGDPAPIPENIANIPVVGWIVQKLAELVMVNTADKTILGFVVIFGIFLASLLVWLLFEFAAYVRRRAGQGVDTNRTLIAWGVFLLLTVLAAFLLKFPLLALLLPVAVLSFGLVWLEPRRTERNVALVLVGLGALIGLTIEVIFLRDNFQARMNTLFKFYFQIWVLWALPAAYGLWRVLYAALGDRREEVEARREGYYVPVSSTKLAGMVGSSLWALVVLFLVGTGLLYSWYGAVSRQGVGSGPLKGLDGAVWLRDSNPGDYDAINWLKANGRGSDRVLEAGHDEYYRPGRVSAYSGVPTLIAWDNSHESLWRTNQLEARNQIGERRRVVNAIYQGQDPNGGNLTPQRLMELLQQYSVDYIFVGDTERGKPGAAPSNANEQVTEYAELLFKYALTEAFRSGDTVIYRVGETLAGIGAIPPTPGAGPAVTPGATTAPTIDPNVPATGLFALAGRGANRGQFDLPRGIARDSEGSFYVADTQNLRIQKFDKDGNWLLMFGGRGAGDGQFSQLNDTAEGTGPGGLALDSAGNVYVADTWNHRIQKFDKDGKFLLAWGGFVNLADHSFDSDPQRDAKFFGPRGVALGPDGNIYVTDTGNKRVLIFDPNGKALGQIGSDVTQEKVEQNYPFDKVGEMNEPVGIAVDKEGNIYVADTRNARIQKFGKDGKPLAQWAVPSPGWSPGPYLEPFLAVDGAGNVYTTAPSGKSVLKFDPAGQVAGEKRGTESFTLQLPTGVWADPDGTVYVVDTNGHSVLKLGPVP